MKPDAFAASVLCWCLHETMKLTLAPTPLPWLIICAIIVAMTVIHPTPQTFALALTFRLADTLYKIPFCWDSFYWCLQIDGGLYILLVYFAVAKSTLHLADRDTLAAWWATTAKYQLAFFYLAAGFWKINTSFLDPSTSCAPIFVLTLLPVLGFVPPAELAPLIAQLSPAMTIVGEMTIGVLLLMPSRKLVRLGIATALLLHIGIALTPPPNNATPFSLTCIIRLLILAPQGVSTALSEFKPSSDLSFIVGLPLIVGLQCTAIVYQRAAAYEEILPLGAMIDWWVFATAAGGMILLRALMHEAEAETQTEWQIFGSACHHQQRRDDTAESTPSGDDHPRRILRLWRPSTRLSRSGLVKHVLEFTNARGFQPLTPTNECTTLCLPFVVCDRPRRELHEPIHQFHLSGRHYRRDGALRAVAACRSGAHGSDVQRDESTSDPRLNAA